MNGVAIQVEGLGKKYLIGGEQKTYDRLGYQISDALITPFRRAGRLLRGQSSSALDLEETIWALKDVSFEVGHGEVIGIIGENGAGKSTLLKILSRITDPSEGCADIYGRVGSLLEVGTGFHPELTGRENIYLNGAILGMTKNEIERKFDQIVDFAEIGQFINTPVKFYSSGMYVRLAFSVAAHLDPEILLVDEVLAVGDVAFQKKCLGKMGDVASAGRTVLFVSHNMSIIQTLCERGICLKHGGIIKDGPISEVVGTYLASFDQTRTESLAERTDRRGGGQVKLINLEITNNGGTNASYLTSGGPAKFTFEVDKKMSHLSCGFVILDEIGQQIAMFKSDVPSPEDKQQSESSVRFTCEIDELLLVPGRYRVNTFVRGGLGVQDRVEGAATFDVEIGQLRGRPVSLPDRGRVRAIMPHRWIVPSQEELDS
jgi:lipopolysaccharide transport system ATP-binding protein